MVQQHFIGVIVPLNVYALVANPNNDGWGPKIFAQPVQSIHGWPTVSSPNPPRHSHISHLWYDASQIAHTPTTHHTPFAHQNSKQLVIIVGPIAQPSKCLVIPMLVTCEQEIKT